jgi:hypothetical protein
MDEWLGIDCTTTSPFSFEKGSGLLMEGWVLRFAYSLPAVRGFAF